MSTSVAATDSAEIEELRQQGLRLRDELQQQKTQFVSAFRHRAFRNKGFDFGEPYSVC